MARVLVVDDEAPIRTLLKDILSVKEHSVYTAISGQEAMELIQNDIFDVAVVDIRMGRIDGLDVLKFAKQVSPNTEVIIMTAYGTIDLAVRAMRLGAYDFVVKPFSPESLNFIIERAVKKSELTSSVKSLQASESNKRFPEIIGKTAVMQKVINLIDKVSRFDSAVLITGESGTGKELVARTIHAHSKRSQKPFIPVSCVAVPETLQESEFFGHVKGAFTDAISDKRGLFEEAEGGTIFFDEVADASLSTQVKLLRFLENGEIRRVGSNTPIYLDVRLISSTKKDISKAINDGSFREDLYYRINTIEIHLPPLRERKDDIPLLTHHFLKLYGEDKDVKGLSKEAEYILMSYDWPGNVRELQNVIQYAITFTKGDVITEKSLPEWIKKQKLGRHKSGANLIHELERAYILHVLNEQSWNITKASNILGIGRTTIYRKLKEYGISSNKHENHTTIVGKTRTFR